MGTICKEKPFLHQCSRETFTSSLNVESQHLCTDFESVERTQKSAAVDHFQKLLQARKCSKLDIYSANMIICKQNKINIYMYSKSLMKMNYRKWELERCFLWHEWQYVPILGRFTVLILHPSFFGFFFFLLQGAAASKGYLSSHKMLSLNIVKLSHLSAWATY